MHEKYELHNEDNSPNKDVLDDWNDNHRENNELVTNGDIFDDELHSDHRRNDPYDTFVVKVILENDYCVKQPDVVAAKHKEAEGLKKRKIWRIVKSNGPPEDANMIGARFVLSLKNYQTPSEEPKARYLALGYNDKEKDFIVHDVNVVRPTS